jgi:hypothetical protein
MVRHLGPLNVSSDSPSYEDGGLAQNDLEKLKLAIHSLGLDVVRPDELLILDLAAIHVRVRTGDKVVDRAGSIPGAGDSPYTKLLTDLTDVPINRKQTHRAE